MIDNYAESIRLDNPKITNEEMMLKKRLIVGTYKNAPLFGIYILLLFHIMTQWLVDNRLDPSNVWVDILVMVLLFSSMLLTGRLLKRYLVLEAKTFYNDIKNLEGKNDERI